MDVDFWTSRVHLSTSAAAAGSLSSASVDGEARAFFPCPFCYVEIELPVLCTHLQEEHCFDLRNAVCPLCAENLGKNPLEHFTLQHTQSIKRRLKSQKSGIWSADQPGLRDISSYLGSASRNAKNHQPAADPLLSPFLFHTPVSDNNNLRDKDTFKIRESTWSNEKRITHMPVDKSHKHDSVEKRQRAAFVEDLVMSIII
ncbi:hypothetical protein QQ045_014441 [Rhodiola kirilowii]